MRAPFSAVAALLLGLPAACGSSASPADGGTVPDARNGIDALVFDARVAPDAHLLDAPTVTGNPDANLNVLSNAGLYSNFATRTVDPRLRHYTPLYPLWADSLEKQRYLDLPAGTQIDTSNMDHWVFPVGTRFWKEFAKSDGTRLETRLIAKTGASTWQMGSYVWKADNSDAIYTEDGAPDTHGTDWDVPSLDQCQRCHDGEPDHFLGFAAIQLGDTQIASLVQAKLLTNPPAHSVALPWDDTTNAAAGMFYGNCSHCHSSIGSAAGTGMSLRVTFSDLAQADFTQTQLYTLTVGVPTSNYMSETGLLRISPDDPDGSAILIRMKSRGSADAMPPISTKHVDDASVSVVTAWVDSL